MSNPNMGEPTRAVADAREDPSDGPGAAGKPRQADTAGEQTERAVDPGLPQEGAPTGSRAPGVAERSGGGSPDELADHGQPATLLNEAQLREALELAIAERDRYLETAQRIQAEFDNFRKRSAGDVDERVKGGIGRMAEALLPVLDACDAAIAQGDTAAEALRGQLWAVLSPRGLEPIDAAEQAFDPNLHDAVLHEQGDGDEAVVVEELRPGYLWNGKVLRAAMVKVRD